MCNTILGAYTLVLHSPIVFLFTKKCKISDSDETLPLSDATTIFRVQSVKYRRQPLYKNVSPSVQQGSCNPEYHKRYENFQLVQVTLHDDNLEPLLTSDEQSKNISSSFQDSLDAIRKKYANAFMSPSLQLS